MKKALLIFIMVAGFAVPALAQTDKLCRMMANAPNTGDADFRPGVDAHGHPVVPADAAPQVNLYQDVTDIPLSIDLARRLALPVGTEMEAPLGILQVGKDGTVNYNGQDITSRSQAICDPKRQPVNE